MCYLRNQPKNIGIKLQEKIPKCRFYSRTKNSNKSLGAIQKYVGYSNPEKNVL